ncbi:E3 ubiquitin-protein ligase BRE1A-like [Branchiostoma floridae]|uniref:E3 ubiquitin-protein ligase BRE1A-like n=1 Tax=Branchiostoma floridae TaxID=7739 RepID=A0A9J7LSZ1_BRAFL|nr:E3 ubiquitin-protein ligase BRE1A-like [Branchiostoma floridae]
MADGTGLWFFSTSDDRVVTYTDRNSKLLPVKRVRPGTVSETVHIQFTNSTSKTAYLDSYLTPPDSEWSELEGIEGGTRSFCQRFNEKFDELVRAHDFESDKEGEDKEHEEDEDEDEEESATGSVEEEVAGQVHSSPVDNAVKTGPLVDFYSIVHRMREIHPDLHTVKRPDQPLRRRLKTWCTQIEDIVGKPKKHVSDNLCVHKTVSTMSKRCFQQAQAIMVKWNNKTLRDQCSTDLTQYVFQGLQGFEEAIMFELLSGFNHESSFYEFKRRCEEVRHNRRDQTENIQKPAEGHAANVLDDAKELEAALAAKEEEIKNLIREHEKEKGDHQHAMAEKEKQMQELMKKHAEAMASHRENQTMDSQKDESRVHELEKQVALLQRQKEQLKKNASDLQERNTELEKKLSLLQAERSKAETNLKDSQKDESRVHELEKQVALLQGQKEQLKKNASDLQERNTELEKKLSLPQAERSKAETNLKRPSSEDPVPASKKRKTVSNWEGGELKAGQLVAVVYSEPQRCFYVGKVLALQTREDEGEEEEVKIQFFKPAKKFMVKEGQPEWVHKKFVLDTNVHISTAGHKLLPLTKSEQLRLKKKEEEYWSLVV